MEGSDRMPWKNAIAVSAICTIAALAFCAVVFWVSHVIAHFAVKYGPVLTMGGLVALMFTLGVLAARFSRREN